MFTIPSQYGYVLLTAMILSLQVILMGYLIPQRLRFKYFSLDFMEKKFGEEHERVFGEKIRNLGYPDMGSGYYSKALSYEQWYAFNNGQRTHQSFLQIFPSNIVFLLVAGLGYPIAASYFGIGLGVMRIVFAFGYIKYGPFGRVVGALLAILFTLLNIILGVKSCFLIFDMGN